MLCSVRGASIKSPGTVSIVHNRVHPIIRSVFKCFVSVWLLFNDIFIHEQFDSLIKLSSFNTVLHTMDIVLMVLAIFRLSLNILIIPLMDVNK